MEQKTIIITGASSGIGEATAQMLAADGHNVVLVARSEGKLENLADDLAEADGDALVAAADVTDRARMKEVASETIDEFGAVDVLVNNAGIMPLSFMKNLHEDEWEQMVDVNIKGVLNGIGAVLPEMQEKESGHIINISSVLGVEVMPSSAVYSATKFAVEAITKGLEKELKDENIRTTVIRPGATATNLVSTITDEEVGEMMDAGEMSTIESEDIARAITYAIDQPEHVDVDEMMVTPTN